MRQHPQRQARACTHELHVPCAVAQCVHACCCNADESQSHCSAVERQVWADRVPHTQVSCCTCNDRTVVCVCICTWVLCTHRVCVCAAQGADWLPTLLAPAAHALNPTGVSSSLNPTALLLTPKTRCEGKAALNHSTNIVQRLLLPTPATPS